MTENLCLKHNNAVVNDPCGLCGQRCDPDEGGWELFLDGTWKLVCDKCGAQHAPHLLLARDVLRAAVYLSTFDLGGQKVRSPRRQTTHTAHRALRDC